MMPDYIGHVPDGDITAPGNQTIPEELEKLKERSAPASSPPAAVFAQHYPLFATSEAPQAVYAVIAWNRDIVNRTTPVLAPLGTDLPASATVVSTEAGEHIQLWPDFESARDAIRAAEDRRRTDDASRWDTSALREVEFADDEGLPIEDGPEEESDED
jgi:hypothetical protein